VIALTETPEQTPPEPKADPAPKKASAGPAKPRKAAKPRRAKPVERPFPRATLERALAIAFAIKQQNGGQAWSPREIAKAVKRGFHNSNFFYECSAAAKFGLTTGGRDHDEVALTELGRSIVYAPDPRADATQRKTALLKVDLFRRVLEYYQGTDLPEMEYLGNTLKDKFGLEPETHTEFVDLFKKNCAFVGIKTLADANGTGPKNGAGAPIVRLKPLAKANDDVVETIAEPTDVAAGDGPTCFVIMPFTEKGASPRPHGFFGEVLNQLIVPAATAAGFRVQTARKKGTEVIQSTIVNSVIDADLVVADLTDHNPNVMFELGMRLLADKPVAIIKAQGTGPVFDVDNMLRVEDYNPNLWASSVKADLPKLSEHIRATWEGKEHTESFLKILRRGAIEKNSTPVVN
jgi:hypothetical protein